MCLGISELTPHLSPQSAIRRWEARRPDKRAVWAEHCAAGWIPVRGYAATAAGYDLSIRWIRAAGDAEPACAGNVSLWLYCTKYRYWNRTVWIYDPEYGNDRHESIWSDSAGPTTTACSRDIAVRRWRVRPTATAAAALNEFVRPDHATACWRLVRSAAAAATATAACRGLVRNSEPATTKTAVRQHGGRAVTVWEHGADTARPTKHIWRVREHGAASGDTVGSVWVDGGGTGRIFGEACYTTTVSPPLSVVLGSVPSF